MEVKKMRLPEFTAENSLSHNREYYRDVYFRPMLCRATALNAIEPQQFYCCEWGYRQVCYWEQYCSQYCEDPSCYPRDCDYYSDCCQGYYCDKPNPNLPGSCLPL